MAEVLEGDHAEDASVLVGDGDHADAAGAHAAHGFAEGVLGGGDEEAAEHDGLDIAVAFDAEGSEDGAAGDDADDLIVADHGEVVLERVNGFVEGVLESVGGENDGEVAEHDVLHGDGVDDGLEGGALVVELRADGDEKAAEEEPGAGGDGEGDVGEEKEADTESGGEGAEHAAERDGGACGLFRAVTLDGKLTKEAAGVEGEGGDAVHEAKAEVEPEGGAEQVPGADERVGEEEDAGTAALEQAGDEPGDEQVRERAGEGEGVEGRGFAGVFLRFRVGRGLEAADGEEQDGAEADVVEGRSEGARGFANGDGEKEQEPEQAAAPAAETGAIAVGVGEKEETDEKPVNAELDAEGSAEREGPGAHGFGVAP